jgi:hypothetical protein
MAAIVAAMPSPPPAAAGAADVLRTPPARQPIPRLQHATPQPASAPI